MKYSIFVINLKRSVDRKESIRNNLKSLGLEFEIVEATDGSTLSDEEKNKYYSKELNYTRTSRYITNNEIACYISHIRCWQLITERKLDFAIIMEDDITLDEKLIDAIDFLKSYSKEIGCLQMGVWEWCKDEKVSVDDDCGKYKIIRYRRGSGGSQIYAMSLRAAETMLKNAIPFGRPVDGDAIFFWQTKVIRRGLIPYTYIYKGEEFESLIPHRKEKKKIRTSIFTRSVFQDIYFWSCKIYFGIAKRFGVKLDWEWWA